MLTMIFLDNVHLLNTVFTTYEESSPLPPLFLSVYVLPFLYRTSQPNLYQQFEIHKRIDLPFEKTAKKEPDICLVPRTTYSLN